MAVNLTVIKGGLSPAPAGSGRTFVSGIATASRLMGVIGLELTWELADNGKNTRTLHQIFYLDCEEFGLESYTEGFGDDCKAVNDERCKLLHSLGSPTIPVSEKEARFLIQSFAVLNKKYKQELPEGYNGYSFLLKPEVTLTRPEYDMLYRKLCERLKSPYYSINYYIMRSVAGDAQGAAFLSSSFDFENPKEIHPGEAPIYKKSEIFSDNEPCVLCRNQIEESSPCTYMCESLIERKDGYAVVTSELVISDVDFRRIVSAERCSEFKITGAEAAMLMNRPEYVCVFNVPDCSERFFDDWADFTVNFTDTIYDAGHLYVCFKDTNDHVGNEVYRINDDVECMYFLADSGQVIVMAYSFAAIQLAELRMELALRDHILHLHSRYIFKNPLLYEFLRSGYDDFVEFIAALDLEQH